MKLLLNPWQQVREICVQYRDSASDIVSELYGLLEKNGYPVNTEWCTYQGCINEPHDDWDGENEDDQICDEHLEDARRSAEGEAQYDRAGDR